jgi:hypothetical protein
VAFGGGVHYRLGAPLARIEGEIVLRQLAVRLSKLRLAISAEQIQWRNDIVYRGPRPGGRGHAVIGAAHILGDGPGRHGESQPRELCLDTSLSPQAILDGHAPDQGPQDPRQGRPTAPRSWPGPPPPIGRPSPAMPAEHGVQLDDEERVTPCEERPTDENPDKMKRLAIP